MTKKRGFLYNRSWADTGPVRTREELHREYVPLKDRTFDGKVIVLKHETIVRPRRVK